MQEQLVAAVGIELERVEELWLRGADIDGIQLPVRDGEERVAVRLHDVGLVDSLLLDVRAGEVDALLGRRRFPGARRSNVVDDERPATEPVRPDEARRLRLGVPEQVGAAAERDQAAGLGGGALSRGLSGRAVGRCAERGGGENRQRRSESDAFAEVHHLIYTSQTAQPSHAEVSSFREREHKAGKGPSTPPP